MSGEGKKEPEFDPLRHLAAFGYWRLLLAAMLLMVCRGFVHWLFGL